jgi:hypothetical protein
VFLFSISMMIEWYFVFQQRCVYSTPQTSHRFDIRSDSHNHFAILTGVMPGDG